MADIPYLTNEEEAAVCEFWLIQYEHLRETGEYASFEGLVTGDGQSYLYDPAWTDALGRFQVRAYTLDDIYEWRGLELQSKETGVNTVYLRIFPSGTYWLQYGSGLSTKWLFGDVNCATSTGNPQEDQSRVLDDLIALREGAWLYRIHLGQFPTALEDLALGARYINWTENVSRWGHQYSYASDGTSFVVAAWPMRGETTQTNGFYLDQTGVIREAAGKGVGPDDPPIADGLPTNPASLGNYVANERAILSLFCDINRDQQAYFDEMGFYSESFTDLANGATPAYQSLEMGYSWRGYSFFASHVLAGSYRYNATAVEYGIHGNRGFMLETSGIVRAANGSDADPDSPIIGTVCEIDESFQPTGVSLPGPARVDVTGDYQISLSELLQLVQHYNVGAYHCDAGSTDGYTTGPGAQDCPPLEMDSAPQDWAISHPELLRGVQLYNSGVYFPCPGSEDGLCVPAEPVA